MVNTIKISSNNTWVGVYNMYDFYAHMIIDSDQTIWMCGLIWIYAGLVSHKPVFYLERLTCCRCAVRLLGVVGWWEGAVYLTSLGRPTDIGLQLGKACYPCSG